MDFKGTFLSGGVNLVDFFSYFNLEYVSFMDALKRVNAVVTGSDFVVFVAGAWVESLQSQPRALVLDVLYHGPKGRTALEKVLQQAGYRENEYQCRHNLGEWSCIPSERMICMVRGQLSQRTVHLIDLPRPVVEVVLSRVYGTMVGTYVTGSGRMVSMFPHLTFGRRRCWVPSRYSKDIKLRIERKYPDWALGGPDKDLVDEVGVSFRSACDFYSWVMEFGNDGEVLSSRSPVYSRLVIYVSVVRVFTNCCSGIMTSYKGEYVVPAPERRLAELFPSMKASLNVNGEVYPDDLWVWKSSSGKEGKGKRKYVDLELDE